VYKPLLYGGVGNEGPLRVILVYKPWVANTHEFNLRERRNGIPTIELAEHEEAEKRIVEIGTTLVALIAVV
jgi:hypothetical protein